MAVVEMSRISFAGLLRDRTEIMDTLMGFGAVEISAETPPERSADESHKVNEEIRLLKEDLSKVSDVIGRISDFDKRKKPLFSSRRKLSSEDFKKTISHKNATMRACDDVIDLQEKSSALKSEINRLENTINTIRAWDIYDIPLDMEGTKYTKVLTGAVPVIVDYNRLQEEINEILYAQVFTVAINDQQRYVFLICHNDLYEKAINILKGYDFSKVTFAGLHGSAGDNIKNSEDKINSIQKELAEVNDSIKSYVENLSDFEVLHDYLVMEIESREAFNRIFQTSSAFIFDGWVPKNRASDVADALTKYFVCFVTVREPLENEEPPVMLDNNAFIKPIESIIKMFSLPSYNEADPSFAVGPFFILFFGLMLSDAGYGLLMAIFSFIVIRKYKPENGDGQFIRLMMFCGISTVFWGALFGSWFGNFVSVISRGTMDLKPLWFNSMNDPQKLLLYSLGIGVIHLFFGLAMKGYNLIRKGKYKDALYDSLFWIIYFSGEVILLLPFAPTINVEEVKKLAPLGTVLFLTGFVLIFLTKGRNNKNIFGRIISGFTCLYDLISFLSDVLSYSRLMALGLATSVIATVINEIAIMGGFSIIGLIGFAVVFVFAHIFNLLINAMGAYVHSIRLQYVEFFGKFYEGGGREFAPLARNTKYIKITESEKNKAALDIAA